MASMHRSPGDGAPTYSTDTTPRINNTNTQGEPSVKFVTTLSQRESVPVGKLWEGMSPVKILPDGSTDWINCRPHWQKKRRVTDESKPTDMAEAVDDLEFESQSSRNTKPKLYDGIDPRYTRFHRVPSREILGEKTDQDLVETQVPNISAEPGASDPIDHGNHM